MGDVGGKVRGVNIIGYGRLRKRNCYGRVFSEVWVGRFRWILRFVKV